MRQSPPDYSCPRWMKRVYDKSTNIPFGIYTFFKYCLERGLISGCFENTWLTFPLCLVVRSQDVFSSSRSWHSWIVDLPYRTVGVDKKDKSHMALRCQRSGGQAQQSHPTVEATRDCYSFAQLMILDDAHIQ